MCGAIALPGTSRAAEPATAAPQGSDADRLFEQGVAARKAGNLTEAETLFQKAWSGKKTWDIAANLGLVEFKLGKLADGAEHVSYAIANLPPTESDSTRESLTRALAAARPDIGEIKVTCDVDGAEIRVGGALKGTTPLAASVFAAPGPVKIEVTKDGYEAAAQTIEAKKGGTEAVTFALKKKVDAKPQRLWPLVGAGAGLTAGAAAVAIGLTVAAKDAQRRVEQTGASIQSPCPKQPSSGACKDLSDAVRSHDALAGGAIGLYVAAGVLGAATLVYTVWPEILPVRPAAAVSPTGAAVVVSGTF
jgi:hypothetical protein